MPNPNRISLFSPDVQAAIDLYVDVFGFEQPGNRNEDGKPVSAGVR